MRPAVAVLAAIALFASALGCGPGEAKAPNPTRPLPEGRAVEIIRRAMRAEHVDPAPGRAEPFSGRTIHVDVGVVGHAYGIAYINQDDAKALGDAIPAPNKKDEKLKLVHAGQDNDTRIVLLFEQNYVYDDQVGEAHEQTTITAENALSRDVREFVEYARTHGFK